MNLILEMFKEKNSYNQQWILFKAFLNTFHSLYDLDTNAKIAIKQDLAANLSIVLRNIFHHQPKRLPFGNYDVQPTRFSIEVKDNIAKSDVSVDIVINKSFLENDEVRNAIDKKHREHSIKILNEAIDQLNLQSRHFIVAATLMESILYFTKSYVSQQSNIK